MLAVKEERTVLGGIELARKTVVAATDEGVVTTEYVEARNINLPGSVPTIAQPSAPLALPPPPPPPPPLPKEFSWVECCFKCDSDREWYQLSGKGFCIVLLLLVMYLIGGALLLAYLMLLCLFAFCGDD